MPKEKNKKSYYAAGKIENRTKEVSFTIDADDIYEACDLVKELYPDISGMSVSLRYKKETVYA